MKVYRVYGFKKVNQKTGVGLGLVKAKNKTNAERIAHKKARNKGFVYFGVSPQYPGLRKKRTK